MSSYPFARIEQKWQNYWEKHKTFKAQISDTRGPKFYVLDMFPYPSGSGLHVGHPLGYTATDIVARYKRHRGANVLHPMGWDSFGLPAENYALKTQTHPEEITKKNIQAFKRQLKALGLSYDWGRELATSDVDYYRWTQWIFVQLYNKGLAYEEEAHVNWCPKLKTVLANEEVIDGLSEVGGHEVIRRPMRQWMLRITSYADRLLEDLEGLDWPENIKEMQRHWIGKKEGAQVEFLLEGGHSLEVFTTRPDTLFGATYVVLAPEHPLTLSITTPSQREAVGAYVQAASKKSDIKRQKEKTGVFTGAQAINPINGQKIPVWVADYVLAHYASGAIMAVPAHDQRDWEFAQAFGLPMVEVIEGGDIEREAFTGDGPHKNSQFLDGLSNRQAIHKAIQWLEDQGLGKRDFQYKLRDWVFSRQRYWGEPFPILKFDDGQIRCLDEDELPVALPEVDSYAPSGTGESPLATVEDWAWAHDPKTGRRARRETHTMPQWAGSSWYYLRFCDPRNKTAPWSQRAENYWMPVDLYIGGVEHSVLHLLYARFWHKVLFDLGLVSTKEPFQKLVNQGIVLGEDGEKMSKSRGNVVGTQQVVEEFGADSLRLYEMFMGPLERARPWQTGGVKGVHNFLARAYQVFRSPKGLGGDKALLSALHKTIKKVGEDIEALKLNTAISALMIFTNLASKSPQGVDRALARDFILLLSPFAPHLAEELWEGLGEKESLAYHPWPEFDRDLIRDDTITLPIQINGKTRGKVQVPPDIPQAELLPLAQAQKGLQRHLQGQEIVKEIYVPGKIYNLVTRPSS